MKRRKFLKKSLVTLGYGYALGPVSSPGRASVLGTSASVTLTVVDQAIGKPVPCDVYIKNTAGEAQRPADLPFLRDHFTCPGTTRLELSPGDYTYEAERGKEYLIASGSFTVGASRETTVKVELQRFANLAAEGWYAGDLHCHLPVKELELAMQAQDIHMGSVMWWWVPVRVGTPPAQSVIQFDQNRYINLLAGEDERGPGVCIFFGLPLHLIPRNTTPDYPPAVKLLEDASRQRGVWIDADRPYGWEMPVWLAWQGMGRGRIDSVEVVNNNMQRYETFDSEGSARARDRCRYPTPLDVARWSQDVYFHMLNCGFRIAPSAGSASGVHGSPLGYNRVYVHVDPPLTYDKWWTALQSGRCFVTNGPLLRPKVNGELPGHVFTASAEGRVHAEIKVAVSTRDTISFLEVIKNGQIERRVPFDEWKRTETLGAVTFDQSGWVLVRAVTEVKHTYRFAMTAPYYTEIGSQKRRISRASAQFFLEWVQEAITCIKGGDYPWKNQHGAPSKVQTKPKPAQQDEFLRYYSLAEKFWQETVKSANAP